MNNKGFQLEIEQVLKNEKRDLIIINREYRKNKNGWNNKYYQCYCNKCSYTNWIIENSLIGKRHYQCSCCTGRTVVLGINTIWDTNRWMCGLGVSEEDAKKYTKCSGEKVQGTCPICGKTFYKNISSIYNYKSICCTCSDSVSYPEKLVVGLFNQTEIEFKTQLNKSTFKWCKNYKYDFYFEYNNEQYICEINGIQHYEESPRGRSLKQEQENDKLKKQLALKNGIKEENYIVIDCRKSDLELIKQNILKSNLAKIFDLNIINWNKVEEFALSNLVKEACEYWNNGIHSTKEIAKIMNRAVKTIRSWLNKGSNIKLCDYDGRKEMLKSCIEYNKSKTKEIEVFKNNILLGIFESACELSRQSEKLFGVKFDNSSISKVCKGKLKTYKGFEFQYVK